MTEKILQSASLEFNKHGFEKASMRTIAKNAGVTTGSLYARFPNKNSLFGALVDPVIENFLKTSDTGYKENVDKLDDENNYFDTENSSTIIIDLIYSNKTAFTLLINCSNGSSYENFADTIVEHEEEKVRTTIETLKKQGFACVDISNQILHMLISSHTYALFEVIRHDLPKEDAYKQIKELNDFFSCGWNKIFGL
ncbi:MAG: TetR/AcrR family transcriptional regulator [Clostridia bacterium]